MDRVDSGQLSGGQRSPVEELDSQRQALASYPCASSFAYRYESVVHETLASLLAMSIPWRCCIDPSLSVSVSRIVLSRPSVAYRPDLPMMYLWWKHFSCRRAGLCVWRQFCSVTKHGWLLPTASGRDDCNFLIFFKWLVWVSSVGSSRILVVVRSAFAVIERRCCFCCCCCFNTGKVWLLWHHSNRQ